MQYGILGKLLAIYHYYPYITYKMCFICNNSVLFADCPEQM